MSYKIASVKRIPAENKVVFEVVGDDSNLRYTGVYDGAAKSFDVKVAMGRQGKGYSRAMAARFVHRRLGVAEQILRWLEVHDINMSDEAKAAGGYGDDPYTEICNRLGGGPLEGVVPDSGVTYDVPVPTIKPAPQPKAITPVPVEEILQTPVAALSMPQPEPTPVVEAPAPVVEPPAPVETPAPAVEAPAPVAEAPASTAAEAAQALLNGQQASAEEPEVPGPDGEGTVVEETPPVGQEEEGFDGSDAEVYETGIRPQVDESADESEGEEPDEDPDGTSSIPRVL